MEKKPKIDNTYYCITFDKELLRDFYVPESHQQRVSIDNSNPLDEYFTPSLVAMNEVVEEKKKTDWDRVNNLTVKSMQQKGRWFFSPADPLSEDNKVAPPKREDFISLLESTAGANVAEYFRKYYHQQGFDAMARTLVQSLLSEQYNKKNDNKMIDLVEVGHGYGTATYINVVREGFVKYDLFNSYSKQRIIEQSEDQVSEPIVIESPMYVRLRGQISADPSSSQIIHQITELSFIINADRKHELINFLSVEEENPSAQRFFGLGRLIYDKTKRVLPPFLKEAQLPESEVLLDFNQRAVAGSMKKMRDSFSSSPSEHSTEALEEIASQAVLDVADDALLKPMPVTFSQEKPKAQPVNHTASSKK